MGRAPGEVACYGCNGPKEVAVVNAVVIGAGARAPAHIRANLALENVAVVACADRSGQGSESLARQYGLRAYRDVEHMLRVERPDLVHIVTGPASHLTLMETVSRYGAPLCTVEKPLAVDAAEYPALQRLYEESRTRFAVCHQFRWHPDYLRCHASQGKLGAVRLIDMSAGMTIAGQGTHILHYGMELNGGSPVATVLGTVQGWTTEDLYHPGPISSVAVLQFANGVRGLWVTGRGAPVVGDPKTDWQHVRVGAYGAEGHVEWQEFGRWEVETRSGYDAGDYGGTEAWRAKNLEAQKGFHRAMLAWLDDHGAPPSTELGRALHEWKCVLALYHSALTREAVDVDSFFPDSDLTTRIRNGAAT
jgi:predicted dehydrogenase